MKIWYNISNLAEATLVTVPNTLKKYITTVFITTKHKTTAKL